MTHDRQHVPLRYVAAAVTARTADEGARVALVLLALQATGSAALGGAAVAALLAPHVVAAPGVGSWLDRTRRPRLVLAIGIAGPAAALAVAAAGLGRLPTWCVLAVLVLGGCGGPAITGGLTSRLRHLVGPQRVSRAFGVDSLFYNVASMAGPALAGAVSALGSARVATLALAALAAIGAGSAGGLPLRPALGSPASGRRTRDGVIAVVRQPVLRLVTVASSVGQLGSGALGVVAAVIATRTGFAAGAGVLLTGLALGAFAGSLVWTRRPPPPALAPVICMLCLVATGVPIAVGALTTRFGILVTLFVASGFFVGPFASALFTVRDRWSSDAVRTQVFTIGAGLKIAAAAAGAVLGGLVAALPTPALLLLAAGAPVLAGAVGTLLLRPGSAAGTRSGVPSSSRRTYSTVSPRSASKGSAPSSSSQS